MSNHTDLDRLIFAFLDGAITEEQSRGLRNLFDANEENLKRFVRLMDMQVVLTSVASTPDATDSEKAEALPRPLMRVDAAARKSEPARGGQSRAHRWNLLPLAAAAAMLAMVGGYFLFIQAGPSGLDKLIAQARSVRTVADMKALNGSSQEAYQRELAQGEGCNLMRLVSLGLATAITGNPREDRQAADLRFVLGQAGKAGAEWQVAKAGSGWGFSLIPVAEAEVAVSAGKGITADEHRRFRELYAKARELARGLYYDQYIQMLESATANFAPQSLLRQAAGFEGGYMYLYEREFARGGLRYADEHIQGSPYREYYLAQLRPSLEARARREQALEANIDFLRPLNFMKDRSWKVLEKPEGYVVMQENPDAKMSWFGLLVTIPEPHTFSGQFSMRPVPGRPETMDQTKVGVGVGFTIVPRSIAPGAVPDLNRCNTLSIDAYLRATEHVNLPVWDNFRVRSEYCRDGRPAISCKRWPEGTREPDTWEPPERHRYPTASSGMAWVDMRFGGLAFYSHGVIGIWRNLQIESVNEKGGQKWEKNNER